MRNLVTVCENKNTGLVLTPKTITVNGEEQSMLNVMVQQRSLSNLSGIGRVSKRVAFVLLPEEAVEMLGLDKLVDGDAFPQEGKIVVHETTEPYTWTDKEGKKRTQEPKINPSTKEVLTHMGAPIYRNSIFTVDVNASDILLTADSDDNTPE